MSVSCMVPMRRCSGSPENARPEKAAASTTKGAAGTYRARPRAGAFK
ncbi:hypothetical protein [Sorangium sp. So ce861]